MVALFGAAAGITFGQVAPVNASDLAKYDTNKNGRLDPDEVAARDAAQSKPALLSSGREETLVLSPFEVRSDNRGYYASNTMSGTRLNSSIEDLAASISIVTKQQMTDFAMLDTNDIFLYEAGTEGTGTYTDFIFDRNGAPLDNTQLDPNNANRIRGIGPANQYFGNFETSGRVPVDPIVLDAVEISRGPNANIFGIGNAAGTVNQQPASANLDRNRSELVLRGDDNDGFRGSLDLNRVLKKGVLAVRGSAVYQHDGYVRKPSGTDTTRYNAMIRFRPFKWTTLTANYYSYHIQGNRPNTTMPRDAITGWLKAGSPTWDPVSRTVTLNGATSGPYTLATVPTYFTNAATTNGKSTIFIAGNGNIDYWTASRTTSTTNPATQNQDVFLVNPRPEDVQTGQPLFATTPSVSSKDLYDWSSINLAAVNRLRETTRTTYLDLQQILLSTPQNQLVLEAGYFREDSKRNARYLVGTPSSSGLSSTLFIDANQRMPDGSPNPHFLHPYVGVDQPYSYDNPLRSDSYRAQLAYKLDLRNEKGALRWLGMHQFLAYGQYKDTITRRISYRDAILDDHSWLAAGTARASQGTGGGLSGASGVAKSFFRYYVGDANGHNVDYAPHDFTPGTYKYVWGNGLTGAFTTEPALLDQAVSADNTGGSNNSRNVLKTKGAVLQSYFLQDRVVTTLGWRQDKNFTAYGTPVMYLPDGQHIDPDSFNGWRAWTAASGHTTTAGMVVKPQPWFSFYYNHADSFLPLPAALDLFNRPSPNPSGKGSDYGFALKLFDGKLVVRVNHYNTKQLNSRSSTGNLIAARVRAMDFDTPYRNQTPFNLYTVATDWVTAAAAAKGQTLSADQTLQQVAGIMKLDPAFVSTGATLDDFGFADGGDVVAKGEELELNYNPSTFWTIKFNLTKDETIDTRLSPSLTQWIDERTAVWKSIIDPVTGQPWFTSPYGSSSSVPSNFLADAVTVPYKVAVANEGKSRSQIRKYHANLMTRYALAGLTDNRYLRHVTVGGALRWEDKGGIGYYGMQQLPAVITELAPNRPIYDKAHLYADAFVAYRTRMWSDKINATFQLNVRNIQENGRLQPISAYPNGRPSGYRIVDPRQFILTATFDL